MADKNTHIEIITSLTESSPSDYTGIVKIDEGRLKEVTDGDDDPRYVVSLIEEGESSNNVTYDRDFFNKLSKQVNDKEPVGYLGHKHFQGADKEDLLPDPQVVWLGSAVTTNDSGKAMLVTKGYLMPASEGGKARGWIKRRAVNSVSWAGDAVLTFKNGKYYVKDFFLESIDFSRKNRAGMKGQRLAVVTEMDNGGKKLDGDLTVAEVAGKLTFHELKEHNPGLVTAIKEMAKDEVKDETATAVKAKEDELAQKHETELKENPQLTMFQKIRDLLGVADDGDPVSVLEATLSRLDDLSKKLVKDWFTNDILKSKNIDDKARNLIGRLVPLTEMEGDWRTEKGIESIKTKIAEKTDDLLENDETVKTVIKEMAASRGGGFRAGTRQRDENNGGDKDTNDDFDSGVKRGSFTVEKVKVGN